MDIKSIATGILWLAILGGLILVGTRIVGKAASKASAATPL